MSETHTSKGAREALSRRLFTPGPLDFFFNPVFLIRRPVYRALREHASSISGAILNFGCGSMPYRDLFSKATRYVGLDFAATEHGLSKPDVVFDGEVIPFPDDSFDAVVMFEVLDDLATPEEQLREIRRVLKPGGELLLTTTFVWELHEEPHDIARYTHHGVKNILEKSGFGEARVDRLGHYQRVIGQAQAMYWYQTLQKIPFGVVAGVAIAGFIQAVTLVLENLVPKRRELWLSNVARATNSRPA